MKKEGITALVLALAPLAALGQITAQPVVIGANYTVNDGPGTQTDPHVSGDLIAYSNFDNTPNEIRYYNLATSTDAVIPSTGDRDYLSDISGARIVFTRITGFDSNIFLFDTTTTTSFELAPGPGNFRSMAAIGGDTVAWVDFGITGSATASEVFVYDIPTGVVTSLTPGSSLTNITPSVSPDGTIVTYNQCQPDDVTCDIVVATKSGGNWSSTVVTGAGSEERLPSTDGTILAYERLPTGGTSADTEIAFQTLGSPGETVITLPGNQSTPSVAGGLIAFQGIGNGGFTDLFVYDTTTDVLYQLTDTAQPEYLSDIDVASDGLVRVTYVREDGVNNGANVYAFSFFVEEPTNTCDPGDGSSNGGDDEGDEEDDGQCGGHHGHHGFGGHHHHGHHHHGHHFGHHHGHHQGDQTGDDEDGSSPATDCSNPGNRPVLATLSVTRTHGAPNTASTSFAATPGNGLLCVTNSQATSGWVTLDGTQQVGPGSFKKWVTSIERVVTLDATNALSAKIAGQNGTSYTVTVYGSDPDECEVEQASISASALRVRNVGDDQVQTVIGERHSVMASERQAPIAPFDEQGVSGDAINNQAVGCSASGSPAGSGAVILALLALAGIALRARPATAKVRVHRR